MYENLRKIINESNNIVCLVGSPLIEECGHKYVRDQDCAYDIEADYGYSPEELFNTVMFSTRPEIFYKYYKNVVINKELTPSATFHALKKLEDEGKLRTIITRCIYGFAGTVGCRNVIGLRGTIMKNHCVKCGMEYSVEYMKNSKGIPQCEKCAGIVRPNVILNGEMINNAMMTQACNAVADADVLLVLGTTLKSDLVEKLIQHYRGNKLVLIKDTEHFADKAANLSIVGKPMDVLPQVV